jgi:hypothetical protein
MEAKGIIVDTTYRVRQWDDMVKRHGVTPEGDIEVGGNCFFSKKMMYLCGKEYTPSMVLSNGELEPEFDDWCIEPWMLEPITKPVGMYGETPRVQVGKFSICRQDDNSVWIQKDDGEGGQFPDTAFEEAIETFYNERF